MTLMASQVRFAHCYRCGGPRRFEQDGQMFYCPAGHARGQVEAIPVPVSIQDRLWENITKTPTCWIWNGKPEPRSGLYLTFVVNRNRRVQVLSWWIATGCLPRPRTCILRICFNDRCVNPEHLMESDRKVAARLRLKRGTQLGRQLEKCPNGHRYTQKNTIPPRPYRPYRACRTCYNANWLRFKRKRIAREAAALQLWQDHKSQPDRDSANSDAPEIQPAGGSPLRLLAQFKKQTVAMATITHED